MRTLFGKLKAGSKFKFPLEATEYTKVDVLKWHQFRFNTVSTGNVLSETSPDSPVEVADEPHTILGQGDYAKKLTD